MATEFYILTSIGRFIGIEVLFKCVTGLTSTANGIYSLIANITSNSSVVPDISAFLINSDIMTNVKNTEILISEIDLEKHKTKTLANAIESLTDCMKHIESLLTEVNTRLKYNQSKWVSFGKYGFADIVKKLETFEKILEKRKNTLLDTLKINSYLVVNNTNQYDDVDEDTEIIEKVDTISVSTINNA